MSTCVDGKLTKRQKNILRENPSRMDLITLANRWMEANYHERTAWRTEYIRIDGIGCTLRAEMECEDCGAIVFISSLDDDVHGEAIDNICRVNKPTDMKAKKKYNPWSYKRRKPMSTLKTLEQTKKELAAWCKHWDFRGLPPAEVVIEALKLSIKKYDNLLDNFGEWWDTVKLGYKDTAHLSSGACALCYIFLNGRTNSCTPCPLEKCDRSENKTNWDKLVSSRRDKDKPATHTAMIALREELQSKLDAAKEIVKDAERKYKSIHNRIIEIKYDGREFRMQIPDGQEVVTLYLSDLSLAKSGPYEPPKPPQKTISFITPQMLLDAGVEEDCDDFIAFIKEWPSGCKVTVANAMRIKELNICMGTVIRMLLGDAHKEKWWGMWDGKDSEIGVTYFAMSKAFVKVMLGEVEIP